MFDVRFRSGIEWMNMIPIIKYLNFYPHILGVNPELPIWRSLCLKPLNYAINVIVRVYRKHPKIIADSGKLHQTKMKNFIWNVWVWNKTLFRVLTHRNVIFKEKTECTNIFMCVTNTTNVKSRREKNFLNRPVFLFRGSFILI